MSKKISVVMTTYNGRKYINDQMDSLRKQTMPIDEVIILDDCSTDDTVNVINKYISKYKLKGWQLISNKTNIGWKKNFKKGFDLSTGEYIFPCDQDDIWFPDKIEKMVECMEENACIELLAANYVTFFSEYDKGSGSKLYASKSRKMKMDGSLEILGINPQWPYINRPGCVFCFKRNFYNSIKDYWDTTYPHDAILWRFARMDHALGLLNYPVIKFRRHGDNVTSDENRTRESRIATFNDYIMFHEIALKRVNTIKDKKILTKGIKFLQLRKKFYKNGNPLYWLRLVIMFYEYYPSARSCIGDLYFVYKK